MNLCLHRLNTFCISPSFFLIFDLRLFKKKKKKKEREIVHYLHFELYYVTLNVVIEANLYVCEEVASDEFGNIFVLPAAECGR